jgi:predicted nuclease of predicted toxin-antitoxin system
MRFLVDAQLPRALARWLTAKGHEAEHVDDCGLGQASDEVIWERATSVRAVIVTKDADFAQRKALIGYGPSIVWVRLPNTRRQDLLAYFAAILPDLLRALESGETLIEVT